MSHHDHEDGPPEQRFYVSKLKMGLLIVPCLLGVAAALQADDAVEFAFADYRWINAAAVLICLFVAVLLFRMAMEKEPLIVINQAGISCRRPPVGTIPWSAIIGIGAGKATIMRRVLMIAVDQSQLDAEGQKYLKNSLGTLSLVSPQLSKFERMAPDYRSLYIPISLLSTSPTRVEQIVQDYVGYYITDRES